MKMALFGLMSAIVATSALASDTRKVYLVGDPAWLAAPCTPGFNKTQCLLEEHLKSLLRDGPFLLEEEEIPSKT
jgi:hypothetical protein